MRASRVSSQRGFTLVEVMMAALVLTIGVLVTLGLIDNANSKTVQTKAREAATGLDRQLIEDVRSIPYPQLTQQSIASQLRAQPGLASAPGSSTYTIKRRGFTYSVDLASCTIDDPRDGIGTHSSSGFCGTSSAASSNPTCSSGSVDANGNRVDASFCQTLSSSVIWSTCNLLGTTLSTQGSGSLAAILGSTVYAEAQAAASATTCGSSSAVAADADPDDYKLVMAEVRWGTHRARQATVVANPGNAGGPAVITLAPTGGLTSITSGTSVGFTATTNVPPSGVKWSKDGGTQGQASGTGTGPWTFTWSLGQPTDTNGAPVDPATVLDGAYLIGARAFDSVGTTGPSRSVTMTINRSLPRKVTGVGAGRNGSVVEIQWQPNPEHDIIGYRAYRVNAGSTQQVCSLTSATNCQDTSPPSASSLDYFVVAVDRAGDGTMRESPSHDTVTVTTTNHPPNPPTNLLASTSNGTVIMRWTAPVVQDIDPGDFISYYQIYRCDSCSNPTYGDRYDRTGSVTDVTYTDTNTGGVPHTYWVTSVDTNLAESTLLGPVTK